MVAGGCLARADIVEMSIIYSLSVEASFGWVSFDAISCVYLSASCAQVLVRDPPNPDETKVRFVRQDGRGSKRGAFSVTHG